MLRGFSSLVGGYVVWLVRQPQKPNVRFMLCNVLHWVKVKRASIDRDPSGWFLEPVKEPM